MVLHKTTQHGSTCSFIQKKKTLSTSVRHITELQKQLLWIADIKGFKLQTSLAWHMSPTTSLDSDDDKILNLFSI
jgi:hypothetical protein